MSVQVEGYRQVSTCIEPSGNNDNKAQIRGIDETGYVIYTSCILTNCPFEDFQAAQLVAEAALKNWDSGMPVGLGTYVNDELSKEWPEGEW